MLDKQKVVDFVSEKLKQQNYGSVDEKGKCRYRFGNLKCAIGHLILDEEYKTDFDEFGMTILQIFKEVPKSLAPFLIDGSIDRYDVIFLNHLQVCHDLVSCNSKFYETYLFNVKVKLNMVPTFEKNHE